ncbi:maternal protein tudor-like [Achroia grisella]|uniref:maternal protein tudor-like n=1 Tax=Achroia grisella TaxID=688607 RepID=UPI0027D2CC1E|nr:maternal protein tudor-like [Achroia grisella]
MAISSEISRFFSLYVTHVDCEGHFLKISGQLDRQPALMLKSLFESVCDSLDRGIGVLSLAALREGIVCAVKYRDGVYYRAKIINTDKLATGVVGVHFIDYGNKEDISTHTIRFLDSYDAIFLQMPGQATDYYLSRIMHPSGKWEESFIHKLQNLLCYNEYPVTIDIQTRALSIISVQFKGTDLSTYLVRNRSGISIPLNNQEVSLLQMSVYNQVSNWQQASFGNELPAYTEHIPFLTNENLPINPASPIYLQQNLAIPFNVPVLSPSMISQRYMVNQLLRNSGNLIPLYQSQHGAPVATPSAAPTVEPMAGPSAAPMAGPSSAPTARPSSEPTAGPSSAPTAGPSSAPTAGPSSATTAGPSSAPTAGPSSAPTAGPSSAPTAGPSSAPTAGPSSAPHDLTDDNSLSPKKSTAYKTTFQEINSRHRVCVTYAEEGPELFTVQFVQNADKFEKMMEDINDLPHNSLTEPPMIGTACLARIPEDRIICRAIVMNLSGSQCKLCFVDFGDIEMVSYYDIFDIPEEFVKLNVFGTRFCLSGLKRLERSPQLTDTFKQLVTGNILTLQVVEPEGPPLIQYVELYLDNKNVLDLLIQNMKDKFPFKRMNMLSLRSKKSVIVSYVDSCIKFYIHLSDMLTVLNEIKNTVREHCENSSSPGELPVGAACCARFPYDDNWYRARITNKRGSKVIVAYVDYGNEQEVNISDLRTITPDLMRTPAQAIKCALKGFLKKPNERKTSQLFENLVLEKTLMAQIVGVLSGDTIIVSLFDETVTPPLDVAKKVTQLSKARGSNEARVTTPSRYEAPDTFSSRRNEEFAEGAGSSRAGREENPWDMADNAATASVSTPDYNWPDIPSQSTFQPPLSRPYYRDNNRNSDVGFDQYEDIRSDDWGNRNRENSSDRREFRGERRVYWEDQNENWNPRREFGENRQQGDMTRSNFTQRERVERSLNSEFERRYRSQESGRRERYGDAPAYNTRTNLNRILYRELQDPIPLETRFIEPPVEVGAQCDVSISWIISPENFYVELLSLKPKFIEMMHKIPGWYKGVKCYTGVLPVGASVLARYPTDGVLYRATVLAVQSPSQFIVKYVDFGNKHLVEAKDIWQLNRQLMELPKIAVHCSLLGVSPKDGAWKASPELDHCFSASRYQCVFQDCLEDQQYIVTLWNNGASVADTLVEKSLAALSEHQSPVTLRDEIIDLSIIVGQQILCKVTHVESFEKFYVQLDLDKAALVESAINNLDESKFTPLSAGIIEEGIHCTLKYEGKIYRAILRDIADTANIKAELPDYGNNVTTTLENLMILPSELRVYYYQSLECKLNNLTTESKMLLSLDELKERLTAKKYIIYINDLQDISLVSTLYDSVTGQKVAIFEPDEGAYNEVVQLCTTSVFNDNFGLAYISHFENLNEFYLQKSADRNKIALLLTDLYKFYEEGTPEDLTSFEVDGLCAIKFKDGNWYRAIIISVEENDLRVQFPDYGNSETVPKTGVKKLDSKFYEPCALALVASLDLVALQEDALAKLTEWTNEKEVQVTLSFGNNGWLASLQLDGTDLSMKLVNEQLATQQIISNDEPKIDATGEEQISLPLGCNQVYISHIDTPGQFWLQMIDKIDKIKEIQAELQSNAATYTDIESRELGTLCVAKYLADDQWYRAEILYSDSDTTTVRFIDYGNTDVLGNQPGLIKVIPDKLKDIECYAVKASVNAVPTGMRQWSELASGYFIQLVGDISSPVDALIVMKDITTYVDLIVNGINITDKLVSEGYAMRLEKTEKNVLNDIPAEELVSESTFETDLDESISSTETVIGNKCFEGIIDVLNDDVAIETSGAKESDSTENSPDKNISSENLEKKN